MASKQLAKDSKPAAAVVSPKKDKPASPKAELKLDPFTLASQELKRNVLLLARGLANRENYLVARLLRRTGSLRRKMSPELISHALKTYYPLDNIKQQQKLLSFIGEVKESAMDVGEDDEPPLDLKRTLSVEEAAEEEIDVFPELQVYIDLLVTIFLIDHNKLPQATECATDMIAHMNAFNNRLLDPLTANAYYYYSLAFERSGKLSDIRANLLLAHRSACLRHDEPSQATLINLILRNYLHFNLYNQADKFCQNTTFPESRTNNQYARYLYYLGRIKSVQLKYSEAHDDLNQALRKAPQSSAIGFRQAASKLLVIVQLLMGDIPERSLFRNPVLKRSLRPYFQLTQALRVGNLAAFNNVMTQFKAVFDRDHTYKLIVRLRHNVIKAGLRRISLSYSRISLADIVEKLHLGSIEDAEYIVAKAIHDGVIDAVIDRQLKFISSRENTDIYSTAEPQSVFHGRIKFCLDIHNEAVKAMRYPSNASAAIMNKVSAGGDDEEEPYDIDEDLEFD